MKTKQKKIPLKTLVLSFITILLILNIFMIFIHWDIFRIKLEDEKKFINESQKADLKLFKKITQQEKLEEIKRDADLLLTAYQLGENNKKTLLKSYLKEFLKTSKKYVGIEIYDKNGPEISMLPKRSDDKITKVLKKSYDKKGEKINIILYYDLYEIIKMFNEYEKLTKDTLYFLKSNGADLNQKMNYPSFKEKYKKEWANIELEQEGSFENENGIFSFITFNTLKGAVFEQKEMDNWILVIRYSDTKIRNLINSILLERLVITKYMEGPIIIISFLMAYLLARKKYLYEELENSAIYDSLTKVYNRYGGLMLLEETRKLMKRSKEFISICFIDLNDLKDINERFGHEEGDYVLTKSAEIFSDLVRESDSVVRLGGDEFLLVLPRCKEEQQYIIAERIEKKIENYNESSKKGYKLTISYGFVEISPYNMEDMSKILKNADKKMHENKIKKI